MNRFEAPSRIKVQEQAQALEMTRLEGFRVVFRV